jgi:drug/metabolite transporter (DMT)-like permease
MRLNEKTMQKAGVVITLAVLANLLWGSAPAFIKTGYAMFQVGSADTFSQILFAGCRFFLAGILTVLLGSLLNGGWLLPKKGSMPKIAVLALFQTIIQYVFFYIGCANAAGYKVSIATSTGSFICILISALLFHQEKLTGRKMLGCLLGFAGVVLVNLSSAGSLSLDMSFMGEGFIMISTISFSVKPLRNF